MQSESEETLTGEDRDTSETSQESTFLNVFKVTDCIEKYTHTHTDFSRAHLQNVQRPRTAHFPHFKVTLLEKRLGRT